MLAVKRELMRGTVVKSTLLKSIINETFTVEDFKSDRLAQYLRCIVQALLPMADDGAAREVLDQAIQVAEEAKQVWPNKISFMLHLFVESDRFAGVWPSWLATF